MMAIQPSDASRPSRFRHRSALGPPARRGDGASARARRSPFPALNQRVGLDVLLDFVPVVGDLAGAALGSYMVWEARNLGMSKWQMARMAGNVGVDFLLGLIPWIGAIPDFFFRSNTRNLQDHQAPPRQASRRHRDHPGRSDVPSGLDPLLTSSMIVSSRSSASTLCVNSGTKVIW